MVCTVTHWLCYGKTKYEVHSTLEMQNTSTCNYIPQSIPIPAIWECPADIATGSMQLTTVEFGTQSAQSLGQGVYVIWWGMALLIMFAAIQAGVYIFKK